MKILPRTLRLVAWVVFGLLQFALPSIQQIRAEIPHPPPSFEVATVKPNHTGDGSTSVWRRDGRYRVENLTLKQIIKIAYELQSDAQMSGGPDALLSQHFDINAKVEDQQAVAIRKMSPEEQRRQMALMLQSLLAERFMLKARWEKKELPVYVLVIVKDGPKFKPYVPQPKTIEASANPATPSANRIGFSMSSNSTGVALTATGESIDVLTEALANQPEMEGRSVVDRTGLNGRFNYSMHWTPDRESSQPVHDDGPSLFTALQEQLGLKVKAEKSEVETIVIDHVEEPAQN